MFDVDYRAMSWRSPEEAGLAVRLALPFVDILIGNQAELMLVAGADDLEAATDMLGRRVPVLVSRLGDTGPRVWSGRDSVVATIGAGDGFASGFLYALLKEKPLLECLHYGNAAAAIVVSRLSCSEAMPTLAEVEGMIAQAR